MAAQVKSMMSATQAKFFSAMMELAAELLKSNCDCPGCQKARKLCSEFLEGFKEVPLLPKSQE